MSDEREILQRAKALIQERQYDRARVLLRRIPDNKAARVYLEKLEEIDPEPQTLEEAKEDLRHVQQELESAEEDYQEQQTTFERAVRVNSAVFIFLGTLLGSLIGAAADFGGAIDTWDRFQSRFYPELCVVGSNTILGEGLGMAADWEAAFEAQNQVRVTINPVGSTAGIELAETGGCAHVLAMSEPMTSEQRLELDQNGVDLQCAAEIGYDIIVFVTDVNNPISIAPDRDLNGILLGNITNWNRLSTGFNYPVTIFVREGSGTTDVLLREFANYDSQGATRFPPDADYETCDTNGSCLDRTLTTNGSLYWVSTSWVRTQPPQYLKVLSVLSGDEASQNPLRDEVDLDEYPPYLQRPLFMYVLDSENISDEQQQLAQDFLRFVRGVEGQTILEDHFFYNHFDQPSDVDVDLPAGFGPIDEPGRRICRG